MPDVKSGQSAKELKQCSLGAPIFLPTGYTKSLPSSSEVKVKHSEDFETLRSARLKTLGGFCATQEILTGGIPPNESPTLFDHRISPILVTNSFQCASSKSSTDSRVKRPDDQSGTLSPSSPLFREVLQLQREILHPGGISVHGMSSDFRKFVAFVNAGQCVWIAGWNTACTELHRLFHIGDQLVSINDVSVKSAKHAFQLLALMESESREPCVLQLYRTPLAKSFAVHRVEPGQNVGLRLSQGTNEIRLVVPTGLAAKVGLSPVPELSLSSYSADSKAVTQVPQTWTLTEINGHPVNMFYEHGETEVLLNAYGSEMSFVVQPSDLIACLRKELKHFRSYKDYIP